MNSGSSRWTTLPAECGRHWVESKFHNRKTAVRGGIGVHPFISSLSDVSLSSRPSNQRTGVFRLPSRGSRPTFSVEYFAIIIHTFLVPNHDREGVLKGFCWVTHFPLDQGHHTYTSRSSTRVPTTFPLPSFQPIIRLPSLHSVPPTVRFPVSNHDQVSEVWVSLNPFG